MGEPSQFARAARDVVLTIDISGSMDARDFGGAGAKPRQRRAGVRNVVGALVERRQGDRMALIVFGSEACVQAPLTEDLDATTGPLVDADVAMAGSYTASGDAVSLAIRTVEAGEIDRRLLILLSDGTDTASRMSRVSAADVAADKGAKTFTVGVGDPDASAEDRVDLATLQDVAARTGARSSSRPARSRWPRTTVA